MITEITKFKCGDGTLFNTLQEAEAHEKHCDLLLWLFTQVTGIDRDDVRDVVDAIKTQYDITLKAFERDH